MRLGCFPCTNQSTGDDPREKNPQEKKFNYAELEAIFILPKMMSSVAKSQAWNAF